MRQMLCTGFPGLLPRELNDDRESSVILRKAVNEQRADSVERLR